ncbi:hypothetical protein FGIG_11668 [Fasciola gigantica]|uniref:USP domain-containing protein n=1 Tax=Fasciola gigantica TaxID=46835 RepID=A0A504YVJ3_FASGI|nr:hypothetical protein FGIG_11668 [Fasciola gigantica]
MNSTTTPSPVVVVVVVDPKLCADLASPNRAQNEHGRFLYHLNGEVIVPPRRGFSADIYTAYVLNDNPVDQLVSVTLSRLSSPPTDTLPFSSYGMKARHHPTSQTVSTNSISTSSSSSSSLSSLSSGASPSLSTSLDDLDETPMMMSTGVPASPIAVHSTSVASPSLTTAVETTSSTEAVKAAPTATLGTPTAMAVTGSSTSTSTPHGSASLSRSELESGSTVQLTSATQTIRLTRLPRVLRLHIKRFRWIGRQREKVGCHVSFPLILDVSDFMLNSTDQAQCNRPHQYSPHQVDHVTQVNLQTPCTEVNPFMNSTTTPISPSLSLSSSSNCARFGEPQSGPMARRFLYHLTGVIVHHGRGFQSGHYTAYCLNDQPGMWMQFRISSDSVLIIPYQVAFYFPRILSCTYFYCFLMGSYQNNLNFVNH